MPVNSLSSCRIRYSFYAHAERCGVAQLEVHHAAYLVGIEIMQRIGVAVSIVGGKVLVSVGVQTNSFCKLIASYAGYANVAMVIISPIHVRSIQSACHAERSG